MSYKSAASSCKVPVPHQDKHLPPDFFEVLLILVPAVPHPEANFPFLHSEAGSYLTGNAALSRPVPDFFQDCLLFLVSSVHIALLDRIQKKMNVSVYSIHVIYASIMIGRIIGLLFVRFHRKSLSASFTVFLILPQSVMLRSRQESNAFSTTSFASSIRSSDSLT